MPIYTVSQISDAIKKTLEGSFGSLQIKGELSNLRLQSSGHYYFTLKDETAQISCALFRADALRLKKALKDGDQVLATGNISVFAPKGTYQLIIREIQHQGLGDLLLKLEALKQKFKAMGYFDPQLKKKLPKFPKTIGVVTSPTGAVIQDIIQTLSRRHKGFELLLVPTKVQGEGSSDEIALAIKTLNQFNLCDVMIVGRGGGSLEDLWCFNDEKVIEAIHQSHIPVISAVGHETDFTLADFVADVRAPTPTAAAEMALIDSFELVSQLKAKSDAISKLFAKRLSGEKLLLEQLKKRPELTSATLLLKNFYFSLDRLELKMNQLLVYMLQSKATQLQNKKLTLSNLSPQKLLDQKKLTLQGFIAKASPPVLKKIDQERFLLQQIKQKLSVSLKETFTHKQNGFKSLVALLGSLNPENVLSKGYAILQSPDGTSTYGHLLDIDESQELRIKMKDGSCLVKVKQKSML